MNYYLKRIDESMGIKEYEMYQEIPKDEPGANNEAYNINFEDFNNYLKIQEAKEFAELNDKQTPTLCFMFYENEYPIGDISIRTQINDYWKKHSGNIFYKIRPTKRNQGYGTIMLGLALKECNKLNFKSVLIQCNTKNIESKRVIEKNNGVLIADNEKSCFYRIDLF